MPSSRLLLIVCLFLAAIGVPYGTVLAQPGSPPPDCSALAEQGYRVESLNAVFPQQMVLNPGHLTSNGSQICDFTKVNSSLGISVSYFFDAALCSVYVRENTAKTDPRESLGVLYREIVAVLDNMKELISKGLYSSAVKDPEPIIIRIHGNDFLTQGVLISRPDGTQSRSFILVGAVRKSIVKVRITMRPDFNNVSDDFLSTFTTALGKILPR